MFKFLITFVLLAVLYHPINSTDSEVGFIESFGNSGAHVFIFYVIFYICKIYSFHIERLFFDGKMSLRNKIIDNSMTLVFCFIMPIFLVRATGFYSLGIDDFTYTDLAILLAISMVIFDNNRKIRSTIVDKYEELIEERNYDKGVFFTGYPPKTADDIIYSIFIMIVVSLIVVLIGSIR